MGAIQAFDKVVVITKKTELQSLIERFNTVDQARFYIEHMGGSFDWYESADRAYRASAEALRRALPPKLRSQWVERSFLPTFTFGDRDLAVTLGPDGLVVNTAKYLDHQPLLAVNPDPERIDGVLIPFGVGEAREAIDKALWYSLPIREITMAEATLNDGRSIRAVNDLFVGQKSHVSARYVLEHQGDRESQSSSGIIVSTGAGSTGWYRAALAGAAGVLRDLVDDVKAIDGAKGCYRFGPESERLAYVVREPFASRTSGDRMVHGSIDRDAPLVVTSRMPQNGVIFGDGVEEDFLPFNSGSVATIGISGRKLYLLGKD